MIPRVKVCGIVNAENAKLVAHAGVDAIGINFYAKSPRCVSMENARAILAELPPFVEPVGLFVNEPMERITEVAKLLGLRTVQIHGDSLPVPPNGPLRVIPAFPIRDASSLEKIGQYLAECKRENVMPAAVLVDAHVPGQFGGTGHTAPWDLLRTWPFEVPLVLAGGLHPDNVGEAVRTVRPYAVDVASGVEASPGIKDVSKVRRFVENAKQQSLPNA